MKNSIVEKYATIAKRGRPTKNGQRAESTRINVLIPTDLHEQLSEQQKIIKIKTAELGYNNGRGLFVSMEVLVNLIITKGLEQITFDTFVQALGIDEVKEL